MQKIVPHLWFDKEAKEAAEFYTKIFPNSKINNIRTITDTPSGDCDIVNFSILNYEFMAISAGPLFKINPSISFHVKCKTINEVNNLWEKLAEKGKILMEIGEYPFSKRYGWLEDKYGVSWQIILTEGEITQQIMPAFLFTQEQYGKVEEALTYYTSIFSNSKSQILSRYNANESPDKEGNIRYASLMLEGQEFGIMESAYEHKFKFNEAISLIVKCKNQEEIEHYWKLSDKKEAEQCGWLKDKYGVSWQVTPTIMDEMMKTANKEQLARVTQAFLKMKKFDIKKLEEAYEG